MTCAHRMPILEKYFETDMDLTFLITGRNLRAVSGSIFRQGCFWVFSGFMLLAVPFSLILLIPGMALYLLSAYAAIGPGIEKRVVQPFEKQK